MRRRTGCRATSRFPWATSKHRFCFFLHVGGGGFAVRGMSAGWRRREKGLQPACAPSPVAKGNCVLRRCERERTLRHRPLGSSPPSRPWAFPSPHALQSLHSRLLRAHLEKQILRLRLHLFFFHYPFVPSPLPPPAPAGPWSDDIALTRDLLAWLPRPCSHAIPPQNLDRAHLSLYRAL